jgi:integrase/recombinase XerD
MKRTETTFATPPVDPADLTVGQAVGRFADVHLAGRNLAPRTRVEYLADLRDFAAFLLEKGVDRVAVVEPGHLAAYLADLDRRGLKGSTRRRKATTLRVFFRFLVQQRHLLASPADGLVLPEKESALPRFLSEAEYKRLLAAARHEPRDLAILELLLQTGIRRLELVGLQLADVVLPEKMPRGEKVLGQLTVRSGKGRKERRVTLNDPACRALRSWLAVRPSVDDPHLFLSKFKTGLGSWGVEDVVKKHLALAGIEGASVHALRHTFATQHVRRRTELRVVQEAMGHESLATTSRYVGLVREQMDQRLQENAL